MSKLSNAAIPSYNAQAAAPGAQASGAPAPTGAQGMPGWGQHAGGMGASWGIHGGASAQVPNASGGPMPPTMPGAGAGAPPGQAAQMTPFGRGGLRGLVNMGQQLAAQMRGQGGGSANPPGQGSYMQSQGGPAMGPGAPQGPSGMGGQPGAPGGDFTAPQPFPPQSPPQVPGTPAYGQPQQGGGIQALLDQLRQQQPQQAQ